MIVRWFGRLVCGKRQKEVFPLREIVFWAGLFVVVVLVCWGCDTVNLPTDPNEFHRALYAPKNGKEPPSSDDYQVSFEGVSDKTWFYLVAESDGKEVKDISNVAIELCATDEVVATSPEGADLKEGYLKWDVTDKFKDGIFSFTLENDHPMVDGYLVIKVGQEFFRYPVKVPYCHGQGIFISLD